MFEIMPMAFVDQSIDKWLLFSLFFDTILWNILCVLICFTKFRRISLWSGFFWTRYEKVLTERDRVWIQFTFAFISDGSVGSNEALVTCCNTVFCLGSLSEAWVTVPLPLSVQVQYSGPGSWGAAGVRWGIAGRWSWPQKELLLNSGTFQYHLACPREPIFV